MPTSSRLIVSSYDWAPGLGSAPDVPHTELSVHKTEGSGVGVFAEPPVRNFSDSKIAGVNGATRLAGSVSAGGASGVGGTIGMFQMAQKLIAEAVNLSFVVRRSGVGEMTWESLLVGGVLLVEIPNNVLIEGSNESFVAVLEYAEEVMKCSKVVVCFKKNRVDRSLIMRTFMFFGFSLIPPSMGGSHGDLLYMSYSLEEGEDHSDED